MGVSVWACKQTRVLNNNVHGALRNGIYVGADTTGLSSDITVSGNKVYDTVRENQYHNMGTGGWAGALVVAYTDRATINDNRIYQNDGEGLISLRSNYATVHGNEIFDNFSVELYIDNAKYVRADGNLIYSTGNTRYFRNGYPSAGIAVANETNTIMNPASDNTIVNNIVVGTRWGFYYGNWESGGGLKNTKIANNTFYGTVQAIINIEPDTHVNNVVQNNIFYQVGSPTPTNVGAGGVTYRNNLWYGGSAGAATGIGDVIGDPKFVNGGGRTAADYKLTSTSRALGMALDLTSIVDKDYFGTTRTLPLDIGSHQFSSGLLDKIAPTVPLNVNASGGDATSIMLTWTASTDDVGVTGYIVTRDGVEVATVSTPTWTDRNVVADKLYAYAVQAVDAAGNRSALSVSLSVAWSSSAATSDGDAPSRPKNLRGTATATTISLDWNPSMDNVGVTGYRIYRDGVRIATISNGTVYTDTNVQPGQTYTYEVEATDAAKNASLRSNPLTIKAATPATSRSRSVRH
jgi:chitodextrinase